MICDCLILQIDKTKENKMSDIQRFSDDPTDNDLE